MPFQVILIALVFYFVQKVLSGRRTHLGRAWQKIGVVGLVVLMIVGILFPSFVTAAANLVGIGRGADLLLYLLFVAFLYFALSQYLKFQDQRDALYRLARSVALSEAKQKYKL